ncbi:MAG: DEAD/DEAH box helicase [Candidatus Eisenbacteria bacterium]|uniref:DEAD/DEAH box helicase n=1 Tax=Eiseniibacteriota bacterium TaxID=2212470 RepID=A0A948RXZ3_UNCEI|nr:DEAD/DEAH box helicase [Candidatus Eisenbacteria bacterium]MBU1949840.1 DEAD/DEAH box helicase [Candidatus Eisenbacteria bacterium]MBU2693095.1 DEAD/DEAH box helicase [Candidatus Eisenbacteria bacterium]
MTEDWSEGDHFVRSLLPRTGSVFFGRFKRLTPIQRDAIPRLLEGRNLLMIAPTATGKTEAVMAPLLERYLKPGFDHPVILYIAPTRALVNDAYRRLESRMQWLGAGLSRKTSDHPGLPKTPPAVLITTPESLDSLLVRAPRYLVSIRALVLDELHALMGTPRGDQLACLVTRLSQIVATRCDADQPSGQCQIVAASATVENPAVTAGCFFQTGGVLIAPGHRNLERKIVRCEEPGELQEFLAESIRDGRNKVLAFANSRAEVEATASRLRGNPPFREYVYAHHGSLSRGEREKTEQHFLRARRALCVATLTLELGIDIGDVDLILLLGPPPSVSALLQRMGRGGRRGQKAGVLAVAASERDELLFQHLFRSAESNQLLQDPPVYDPSVVLQQALSVCLQNRRREVDAAGLLERIPEWQQDYWTEERLTSALRSLYRAELLEEVARGVFGPSPDLEEQFRRGTMHANIASDGEITVWDDASGRVVGSVDPSAASADHLTLGAVTWEVTHRSSEGLRVSSSENASDPRFRGRGFPLTGARYALRLKQDLGIEPHVLIRCEQDNITHFFHAFGSLWGELLRHAVVLPKATGYHVLHPAWGLSLEGSVMKPVLNLQPKRLEDSLLRRRRTLVRRLPFGPYFDKLPEEEQDQAILRAFRIAEFLELIQQMEVVTPPTEEIARQIVLFSRDN